MRPGRKEVVRLELWRSVSVGLTRELEARPLLVLAGSLAIGLALFRTPALGLLAIPLLWAAPSRWPWLLAGMLAGLILVPRPVPIIRQTFDTRLVGTVASVPRIYDREDSFAWTDPRSTVFEFASGNGRLMARVSGWPDLSLGDQIVITGRVGPLSEGMDERALRRLSGRLFGTRVERLQRGPWPAQLADRWRRSFVAFCERTLPPRTAVVLDALCFNVDTLISEQLRSDLTRSGTLHIVSASGMHVLLLVVAIQWLLSRTPLPRAAQLVVMLAFLSLYGLAAGMGVPIVRAIAMAMTVLAAYLVRREPDYLSAIGLAVVLSLLWQPWSLFDVSFQLSFAAVMGLALFAGGPGNAAVQALRASIVSTLATAPILVHWFGQISWIAPLSNLLIVAVIMPLMVLPILAHLVSLILPGLGALLMTTLVGPLAGFLLAVIEVTGRPRWVVTENLAAWPPLVVALYYGLLISLWRPRRRAV